MADNQQMDHYDYINAPQFVDFSDLAAQDDPDADKFFETHKEEDDFMIPLDINAISPTVQLLYDDLQQNPASPYQDDDNQHYSNQANKAAMAAGLGDVKIEYYASPKQQHQHLLNSTSGSSKKTSLTSVYGTPSGGGGGASGLSSGVTSFYTPPTGLEEEVEDKENATPEGNNSYVLTSNKKNQQRSVLSDNVIISGGSLYGGLINKISNGISGSPSNATATQSLMSRLNELSIVSSDEDEVEVQVDKQKMPMKISNAQSPVEENQPYSTFNSGKMEYLGMGAAPAAPPEPAEANDSTVSESGDVTMVVHQGSYHEETAPQLELEAESDNEGDKSGAGEEMEMGTTVKNILNKLDAELSLGEEDDEEERAEQNEMRCSIVVAPKIGEQVHWTAEGGGGDGGDSLLEEMEGAVGGDQSQSYEVDTSDGVGYDHLFQGGNGSILDYYGLSDNPLDPMVYQTGRASSVGDLMEPRQRQFETFGYNPRVGITIPKTPEVRNEHQMGPPPHQPQQQRMNRNGCYFEVDAPAPRPKPVHKSVRRVSSCSDLISIQQKMKRGGPPPPPPQKKGLTIPRTPEALKRSQRALNQGGGDSAVSSVESSSSRYGYPPYRAGGGACAGPKGPSVSDRLAAARSRAPMKANHYVSMAEAMIKYQKNTPDRFRSLPRGRLVPEKRSSSCDARNKRAPSPSTFRSPDTSILSRGTGSTTTFGGPPGQGPVLPKRTELKPTIPKPFNLSSGSRSRPAPPPPAKEDPSDFKFKARPVPSKVLQGHQDNPNMTRFKAQVKVTQPMSPHFASDARLRDRHQKRAQKEEEDIKNPPQKPPTKQSRIPASTPRAPHHDDHKTTTAQPFSSSFDARQKEVLRRKEEKIKQELADISKNSYSFHANPVPKYSSSKLPKKKIPEPTSLAPFRLKSDERGALYQEAFKKKLVEEQEQLKEQAQFHAQPADVIHKAPFEPERPTRVIEGPLDIQLATERRAAERGQFDEHIREKEREEEERQREEQERLEELQKQEVIERRRQLVHKAQPFKDPRPFQLKSSGKPLTVPQSPAFNALPSARRVMNKSHDEFNHN